MRSFGFTLGAIGVVIACGGPAPPDACGRYYDALAACSASVATVAPADNVRERARFVASCEARLALPGTSLTASWIDSCAAAIPSFGCLPLALDYGACAVPPGKLPVGAACEDDAQCASTSCSSGGDGCGQCVDTIPAGGDCPSVVELGEPCVAGTVCIANTCSQADFAGAGESCDDESTFCQKDLVCFPQTCASPQPLGAPCFRYSDCAAGLTCSDATGGGGTCVVTPAPVYASPGGACSADVPCLTGACDATTSTCPSPAADGQPCTASPDCDEFSVCVSGTCETAFAETCP
ncbi:MAG TPA: hypothetical protein VGH28_13525 [Polyangiaceae bacterium]|jgi:hypothetical protein